MYYHNPLESLEYMLNYYTNEYIWKHQETEKQHKFSRPWTTQGWKEYEEIFQQQLSNGFKLLMPSFFVDEYQSRKNKKRLTTGIYMTCANALKRVNKYSKILLTTETYANMLNSRHL